MPDDVSIVSKRIFIGGLGQDVSEQDIDDKFSRFGKISNLNLKQRKDSTGLVVKSFAHLNIDCKEADLKKCFATFQNAKWKGSTLKLQYAKESFLNQLDKERSESKLAAVEEVVKAAEAAASLKLKQTPVAKIFTGPAAPGTQVPGKPDWIVGKYGRVLPVMKLKKSSHMPKVLKHDPSKLCHAAKVFKDSDVSTTTSALSWEMDTTDSPIVKKIKGEFKPTPGKKRKQPLSVTENIGNKKFVLENITSSQHYLEMRKSLPAEDAVEVVTSDSFGHVTGGIPKHNVSNRFDSDSETEPSSYSEVQSKVKLKKRNSVLDGKLQQMAGIGSVPACSTLESSTVSEPSGDLVKKDKLGKRQKKQDSDMENESLPKGKKSKGKKEVNSFNVEDLSSEKSLNESLDSESDICKTKTTVINEDVSVAKHSDVNKQSETVNFRGIPKFGGLGMLFSEDDTDIVKSKLSKEKDSDKDSSTSSKLCNKDISKTSNDNDLQTESSTVPSDSTLKKKKKKEKKKEMLKSESPSTEKKKIKSEQNELNDITTTEMLEPQTGYDSADSADTDEILRQHKTKKTQEIPPPPPATESKPLSKERDPSLDQKLLMMAGTGAGNNSESGRSAYLKPSYDSDDSELDDNDFELVAKRLAQKEAAKKNAKQSGKTALTVKPTVSNSKEADQTLQSKEKKAVDKTKELSVNEKRLQAVKEKMKMKQQQQSIMTKALDNVDNKKSNQRKVFTSDDEDDETKDTKDKEELTTKTKKKAKEIPQSDSESKNDLKLFDNSDESEDSDYDEMFKSRPHLEGKKGERLMKLERKIGDSRFKLDAKFVESDSEAESEEEKVVSPEKSELAAERAAHLKVLEKVVGKSKLDNFTRKIKSNTKTMIDMNTVRFDPTKMAAALPDKSKQVSEKSLALSSHDEKEEEVVEEVEAMTSDTPEVNVLAKSSAVVSSSLADLFKKEDEVEESGGFSLLSQFGEAENVAEIEEKLTFSSPGKRDDESMQTSDDEEESDDESEDMENEIGDSDEGVENSEEEMDETDEEEDGRREEDEDESEAEDDKSLELTTKAVKTKTDPLKRVDDSDASAEESEAEVPPEDTDIPEDAGVPPGVSVELWSAGRVDVRYTKDKWMERWEDVRPVLVKIYKKKHKDAVKKKKIQSEQKRRKELAKNSRRNSWFRKKRS